jgi:hypothetical protein
MPGTWMLGDARQQAQCQIWQHADISMACYFAVEHNTTQVPEGHMVGVGMVIAGIRFYITTDQTKQTNLSRPGRIHPHDRSDLGPDGCHLSAPGIVHGRNFRHIRPHWDHT